MSMFSLTAHANSAQGEASETNEESETIYYGFTNIVNYRAFTPGETYLFAYNQDNTYSGKDAILSVPEGSAFLQVYKNVDNIRGPYSSLEDFKNREISYCKPHFNIYFAINDTEELKQSEYWDLLTDSYYSSYDFYIDKNDPQLPFYNDEYFIDKYVKLINKLGYGSVFSPANTWEDFNVSLESSAQKYVIEEDIPYYKSKAQQKYGEEMTDEQFLQYLNDNVYDKYENYWAGECKEENIQLLVDVIEPGIDFDTCPRGTVGYYTYNDKLAWYYSCCGSAVVDNGPFNAYAYKQGTFTADDVVINRTVDEIPNPVKKEHIKVSVKIDGTKYEIPDASYDITDSDPEGGIGIKIGKVSVNNYPIGEKVVTSAVTFADDVLVTGETTKTEPSIASGAANYESGESVTISAGDRSKYAFNKWDATWDEGKGFNDLTILEGDENSATVTFKMPDKPVLFTANYAAANDVITNATENGIVTPSSSKGIQGETITVTTTSYPGYSLETLKVYKNGDEETKVELKDLGGGQYSFTMPAYDVRISATFKENVLGGSVNITGTTKCGQTLTADTSGLTGTGGGTLSYVWMRGTETILGATASTYTLTADDIGKTITVTVSSDNATGTVTSPSTSVVEKADAPDAPKVKGAACASPDNNDGKITGTTAEMEYSLTSDFAVAFPCTETETVGLANGTYYVRYKETSTTKAGKVAAVTVAPYTPMEVSYVDGAAVYNGTATSGGASVTVTKPSSGATIMYGTTEEKYDLDTMPTFINAGIYKVYYKVTATDYTDYKSSLSITISKAPGSLIAPTAKALTYTGSEQALVDAGSSSTGTIQYKLGNGVYSTEIPKATEAGTYIVYYRSIGDSNHLDVAESSLSVVIDKPTPVISPVDTSVASSAKSAATGDANSVCFLLLFMGASSGIVGVAMSRRKKD